MAICRAVAWAAAYGAVGSLGRWGCHPMTARSPTWAGGNHGWGVVLNGWCRTRAGGVAYPARRAPFVAVVSSPRSHGSASSRSTEPSRAGRLAGAGGCRQPAPCATSRPWLPCASRCSGIVAGFPGGAADPVEQASPRRTPPRPPPATADRRRRRRRRARPPCAFTCCGDVAGCPAGRADPLSGPDAGHPSLAAASWLLPKVPSGGRQGTSCRGVVGGRSLRPEPGAAAAGGGWGRAQKNPRPRL